MKCNNCNSIISEDSIICPYCNKRVDKTIEFGDINQTDYDNKLDIKAYIKEPKNKKVVIMGISVIIFVLFIFVVLIMSLFRGKVEEDYKLFSKVVSSLTEHLIDNYTGSSGTKSGEYFLELKVNGNETNFDGLYELDTKNKIFSLTGKMKDPNANTGQIIIGGKQFDFKTYYKEGELFFQSNQVYGTNYILFPIEDEYGFLSNTAYDLSTIIRALEEAIVEALKVMDYHQESAKIVYRGEEITTNKKYFLLDNAGKQKFFMKFYETLAENTNFLNEISRIQEKPSDEIKELLNSSVTKAQYAYSGTSEYQTEFALYYKKNKLYRIEALFEEENLQGRKINFDIGDNKYYLDIYQDDKNIYNATLAVNMKETTNHIIKTYDITFDSDKSVIDLSLRVEAVKQATIKKQTIANYKNIRDFTAEDYALTRSYLSGLIDDVSWLENFGALFISKCDKAYNCVCDGDTCSCKYDEDGKMSVITCPNKPTIGTQEKTE